MRKKYTIIGYLSLVLVLCTGLSVYAQSEKIDQEIYNLANDARYMNENDGRIPVVVVMEPIAKMADDGWSSPTPAEVQHHLLQKTREAQWALRTQVNEWVVSGMGASVRDYQFLWSTNTLLVKASPEAIWEMARMNEVTQIFHDYEVQMEEPVEKQESQPYEGEYTYGLQKIRVPELRIQYPDVTGNGVIVGILDTGLDANHPEVRGKMIAWRDFINGREEAYDDNGHGTHVAGTIGGEGIDTQIGVAPEVRFVIGKIFTGGGYGNASSILLGMEWMANPDRKLNTELRPRVVNNSWGGGMSSDIRKDPFAQQVVNWVQLQIFPSFAAGNSGRAGKSTVGSPGGLPMAFAVGATNSYDERADFSSQGPVKIIDFEGKEIEYVKPDIAAPGHQVLSAMPGGRYAKMSGTSMATPHLTGAVALLYQVRPDLSVNQMMKLLMDSSEDLGTRGKDNEYGAGRLDVFRAVDVATSY